MNHANKLTVLRMILVPIYAVLMYSTEFYTASLIVFILASLTDFADGYIARRFKMITDFGKFMDPLADKLLTMTAFILFNSLGLIHPYIVVVVIAREITISVFRAVAASQHIVIAAANLGKFKTVLQIASIIMMHLYQITGNAPDALYNTVLYLMVLITLVSGFEYILKNRQVLEEK